MTAHDLKKMYENIKHGNITLWCDQKTSDSDHVGP